MLDIRLFRENINAIRDGVAAKNVSADVDRVVELDRRRRELVGLTEDKQKERKELSVEVGKRIKAGEDAEAVKAQVRQITEDSESMVAELAQIDTDLDAALLNVPNLPHESVPRGRDETGNVVVRTWGEAPAFEFPAKPHWELATELGVIDFEEGTRISGSGFIVYKGPAARLQRMLINFMLDLHTGEHGYTEILPPYLVNRASMTGTGQLPKFEEDAYKVDDDLFLIPTAEVPLTNLNREKILPHASLPLNYTAYTPCFRREAGSYGRETRGITRIHQFDKVELVKLVLPEDSFTELQVLLGQAEAVLQRLGLHYRVLEICTGDLGFSNVKQYDLEVWAPGMNAWLEVSSCSNFTDYQARRANIRFRRDPRSKPEFVHTLNGSGLALPRTMVAIFEQYQQADGSVGIPDILKQSFGADKLK